MGLTSWQKGQSGNPRGRPKDVLSMDQVKTIMQRVALMSFGEVFALALDDSAPIIETTIASIFIKARALGDPHRLEFLMQRTWGKVKEEVTQTVLYNPALDEIPRDKILTLLRETKGPKKHGE